MIKCMLYTNIRIYIIKRKPTDVIERFRQTEISQVGISTITLSELESGVERAQNQIRINSPWPSFWLLWKYGPMTMKPHNNIGPGERDESNYHLLPRQQHAKVQLTFPLSRVIGFRFNVSNLLKKQKV